MSEDVDQPAITLYRHLAAIEVGMADPWSLLQPRVFRYIDAEFADLFFDTGALRLSSFETFAQHDDEQRFDKSEGVSVATGVWKSDDGEDAASTVAVTGVGANHYVLCGSTIGSRELQSEFGATGCFAIENPLGFAHAVRRHIPGCVGGSSGLCIYQGSRTIHRKLDHDPRGVMEGFDSGDGTIDMAALPTLTSQLTGVEPMLLKPGSYAPQSEYRFLWRVNGRTEPTLDIVCPEARQFCVRVEW